MLGRCTTPRSSWTTLDGATRLVITAAPRSRSAHPAHRPTGRRPHRRRGRSVISAELMSATATSLPSTSRVIPRPTPPAIAISTPTPTGCPAGSLLVVASTPIWRSARSERAPNRVPERAAAWPGGGSTKRRPEHRPSTVRLAQHLLVAQAGDTPPTLRLICASDLERDTGLGGAGDEASCLGPPSEQVPGACSSGET
jgi:hypothetical protein